MVRLIVETPLADNEVGASVLDALDHIVELALLVLAQLLVLLHAGDVEFMLGLRAWGLEWACENSNLRVTHGVRHLWV